MAFLWPALMAESASEFASAVAREFVDLAIGPDADTKGPEPGWTTPNSVVLEPTSVRLRDFSTAPEGVRTLVCAPFALHGATIADFTPHHSLVAALQGAGLTRVLVTEWRSASPDMRFHRSTTISPISTCWSTRSGGTVDLVGLCQGGWMALIYAARFPTKIRKLVLAGAPIDLAAGNSKLSNLARETPFAIFKELVDLGNGRVLGAHALRFWEPSSPDREMIARALQSSEGADSSAFRVEARFRDWYAWTVDLPGAYYLQVVEQLSGNRPAAGRFVALMQVDLKEARCSVALAARGDRSLCRGKYSLRASCRPQQGIIRKATARCEHLGLFMVTSRPMFGLMSDTG
jgi:poly(3-hydroxyalkanoate) synthetase